MANEDLFPPLRWDNWDELSVADNNQRYFIDKMSQEQMSAFWDDINLRYPLDPNTGLAPQARLDAIQQLRDANKLTPYNYVPPRHALEPHMGFPVDQNNAYRLMGERIPIPKGADPASVLKDKTEALSDFLKTGQVRGNPTKVNGGRVYSAPSAEQLANYQNDLNAYNEAVSKPIPAGWTEDKHRRYINSLPKPQKPMGKELPQAYFFPRHPQPTYYVNSDLTPTPTFIPVVKSGKPIVIQQPTDGFVGQNTMIEISKDFAPINQTRNPSARNPLYYMGNRSGDDATLFRGMGGSWGENTGAGAHITANPRENPTFLEVANPANRKGIRILQESAPALTLDEKIKVGERAIYGKTFNITTGADGFDSGISGRVLPSQTAGTAPEASNIKWTTKYDRITPFSQRPLSTHVANAKAEGEIFLNAAKSRPLSTKIGSLGSAAGLGGAAKAVGLVAGGVITPLQIGMQVNAATSKNMMDREYGQSDPFALRPAIDLALSGIGNNQTPAEGYRDMGRMVADPEWQIRNPISAVPYNLIHGNLEPLKAFAEGYVPNFLK